MTTLRLDPYVEGKTQSKYGGPIWYVDPEKQNEDIDIEHLVLDVVHNTKKLRDVEVSDLILEGEVERTIEGASTFRIVLHDPDNELLDTGIFDRAIDTELDGLWFRLVAVNRTGSTLELVFEDRLVAYIRSHRKIVRMSRGKVTRLEFCLFLVRKIKQERIRVVSPELHKTQPQEKLDKEEVKQVNITHPGLNREDDLTAKGQQLTSDQVRILEQALDTAEKMNAPRKFMLAMVMVLIQESLIGQINVSSSGNHRGPFHQDWRPGSVWRQMGGGIPGTTQRAVRGGTKAFITMARKIHTLDKSLTSEELAEKVQVAGTPSAWGQWKDEATAIVDAWGGRIGTSDEDSGQTEQTYRKQFSFTTEDNGKPQDWWEAIGSILQTTGFSRFVSNGILYLVSQQQLMRGKVRMVLSPDTPGVTNIDFGWDVGQREATATITCRASRWIAPPGTVIKLKGCGPASGGKYKGKWLVSTVRRDIYSRDCTIELKQPDPILKEPAPETSSRSVGSDPGEGPALYGWPDQVSAAYRMAKIISEKHYPYAWGGGHPSAGKPSQGQRGEGLGYDCSGSVAAVLVAGGWWEKGTPVPRSDAVGTTFKTMRPGKGKYITIWSSADHIFMEFHKEGKRDKAARSRGPQNLPGGQEPVEGEKTIHFGTGRWGKTWGGAGINPQLHPHAGFKPTHPAGF